MGRATDVRTIPAGPEGDAHDNLGGVGQEHVGTEEIGIPACGDTAGDSYVVTDAEHVPRNARLLKCPEAAECFDPPGLYGSVLAGHVDEQRDMGVTPDDIDELALDLGGFVRELGT